MQTSYGFDFNQAIAGMPVDGSFDPRHVESWIAFENLDFGIALFKCDDTTKPNSVRAPKRNKPVIVFAGDLITANVVNGFVNGVALAPITFGTDHVTTVTALADAIVAALLAQGIVATYALSGSNRTITFTAKDANVLFATFVVTAGSTQTTATLTHGTNDAASGFRGIARYDVQQPRASDNLAGFAPLDAVPVVRGGKIWSPITADVTDGAAVYVNLAAGSEGKLTSATTAPNLAVTALNFRGAWPTAGLGLAQLELNMP